jgi:hypothetical protein
MRWKLARDPKRAESPLDRRRSVLALCVAGLLALVPSLLLVLDQWFHEPWLSTAFESLWHRVPFLADHLAWPPYFLLVVLCYGALLLFFGLTKRDSLPWRAGPPDSNRGRAGGRKSRLFGRILVWISGLALCGLLYRAVFLRVLPGWELLLALLVYAAGKLASETSASALIRLSRRKRPVGLTLVAVQTSLLAVLVILFVQRRWSWIFLLALAGSILLLFFQRRRVAASAWIVLLAISLGMLHFNSWWFTLIGDEAPFWRVAREIVQHPSVRDIGSHLFLLEGGVFGSTPYVSSLIQAVGMLIAGANNFGWKFSNIYLSAFAIVFLFRFYRTFAGKSVAVLACLFLAGSHYLMSFAKIGYSSLHAYLAMALVLGASAWAVRTRRPFAFTCVGFAMASCLYLYPAALYVLPLPVLLLFIYDPPKSPPAISRWANLLVAFLIPFPWLLQPGFLLRLPPGVFVADPDAMQSASHVFFHVASSLSHATLSTLYSPGENHFVGISYTDPLTAAWIVIGFAVTLPHVRENRFARFLILGWITLLLLVGGSHEGTYPRTTRMFLLLPWFALLAAIGLSWIAERARSAGLSRRAVSIGLAAAVVVMIGLNYCQAYVLSPRRMQDDQSFDSVFYRVARRVQDADGKPKKIVILTTGPTLETGTLSWTAAYGLTMLREVYRLPALSEVRIERGRFPEGARERLRDGDTVVFLRPEMDEVSRGGLERRLAELGKVPCPARNMGGDVQLVAWQSPNLPPFCQ